MNLPSSRLMVGMGLRGLGRRLRASSRALGPLPRKNGTTEYKHLPPEAVFANTLGLLIILFGVLVLGALARPSWKRPDADSPDSRQVPAPLEGVCPPPPQLSPGWGGPAGSRQRVHSRSPHSPCSPPSADAPPEQSSLPAFPGLLCARRFPARSAGPAARGRSRSALRRRCSEDVPLWPWSPACQRVRAAAA